MNRKAKEREKEKEEEGKRFYTKTSWLAILCYF